MRRLLSLFILVVPLSAQATGHLALGRLFRLFEVVIPDLRFEWTDDDNRLLLTVPLNWAFILNPRKVEPTHIITLFVEPQFSIGRDSVQRAVAGAKVGPQFTRSIGAFVEGGGVLGTDGHGGMAGGGVHMGSLARASILFSYRSTWADEHAHSVSFGVEIPFHVIP